MSIIDKIKLNGTTYDVGKIPDTTLTQSGQAADAKAAGDEISDLKSQIDASVAPPTLTWTVGKYIHDGAVDNSTHYAITDLIPMQTGDLIDNTQTPTKDPSGNYLNTYLHLYSGGVWQERVSLSSGTKKYTVQTGIDGVRFMFGGTNITASTSMIDDYFMAKFYLKGMSYSAELAMRNDINSLSSDLGRLYLGIRPSLTSADDCDDLTIGSYVKDTGVVVAHGVNSNVARIVVYDLDTSTSAKTQMWFDCSTGIVYYRTKRSSRYSWTDWENVSHTVPGENLYNPYRDYTAVNNALDYTVTATGVHIKSKSAGSYHRLRTYITLEPNTTYTLSIKKNTISGEMRVYWGESTDGGTTYPVVGDCTNIFDDNYTVNNVRRSKTFKTTTGYVVFFFLCTWSTSTIGEVDFEDIMVLKGAYIDPEYQPVFVTADDPVRRAYDYNVGRLDLRDGGLFRLASNPDPIPVGSNALGYTDFINTTWETLRTDYPDIISRDVVIQSSTSETVLTSYPIYKYVITPEYGYKYTVMLTAGVHGAEYEGFWGLYRLMRLILDEGYKYPNLRRLRHDVRFIIVPSWNPWGVQNKERNCPLGFRADSNLNASVEAGGVTYPAFTCNEAQSIKLIIDSYSDICLWLDLHTDPNVRAGTKKGIYGYCMKTDLLPKPLYALTSDFRQMAKNELNYVYPLTIYDTSTNSVGGTVIGYGYYRRIPTSLLEISTAEDLVSGSAVIMKYATEWYGNALSNFLTALLNISL